MMSEDVLNVEQRQSGTLDASQVVTSAEEVLKCLGMYLKVLQRSRIRKTANADCLEFYTTQIRHRRYRCLAVLYKLEPIP